VILANETFMQSCVSCIHINVSAVDDSKPMILYKISVLRKRTSNRPLVVNCMVAYSKRLQATSQSALP